MDSVPTWVLLVCLGALGALLMFFLAILRTHMEKDAKVHEKVAVHEHVIAKIEGHESRLTKVEAQSGTNTEEISKLREMRHDILDEVSHKLSGWYLDIVNMIKGGK